MRVRPVCLDVDDAVELGELRGFLGDWLAWDSNCLGDSLRGFMSDGDLLFGGDEW